MKSESPSYVYAWIASLLELRKVPLMLSQLGGSPVASQWSIIAGTYHILGLAF